MIEFDYYVVEKNTLLVVAGFNDYISAVCFRDAECDTDRFSVFSSRALKKRNARVIPETVGITITSVDPTILSRNSA